MVQDPGHQPVGLDHQLHVKEVDGLPGGDPYVSASDVMPFALNGTYYAILAMKRIGDLVTLASPLADVSIAKTADAQNVVVGSNVTYTITVSNGSATTATNVQITDTLPSNATLVSTSSVATCSGTTTVTCTFDTLGAGSSATVQIVAQANALGDLTNTATVTTPGDPNAANNSASTAAVTAVDAAAIPTMSEWMLLVLALTIGVAALRAIR